MTARINEFITDARKIVANGEEPLRHLAAGDEQSACNVISISHYAMGDVSRDYDGIVEAGSAVAASSPAVRSVAICPTGRSSDPFQAQGSSCARAYAHFSSSCPAWPRAVGAAQ